MTTKRQSQRKDPKKPKKEDFSVPIFHVASMARCGETMVMRALDAHPNLKIVHNLHSKERPEDLRLFKYLKDYKEVFISTTNPYVQHISFQENDKLIIKQGVWEHPYPFNGFCLVRNPLSVFSSLKTYDAEGWESAKRRLKTWAQDIDSDLVKTIESEPQTKAFSAFYNRRMAPLAKKDLSFVRYENLVMDPETEFQKICESINTSFHPSLLSSHKEYKSGKEGHGKNDLGRSIDVSSLTKFKSILTQEEIKEILFLTESTTQLFGYKTKKSEILIPPSQKEKDPISIPL